MSIRIVLATTCIHPSGNVLSQIQQRVSGPSGATTRDDAHGRRAARQARSQNLSTMPTSNVTSESVLEDSTPPNLTVGSNRRYRRPGVGLHAPPNPTSRPPPTSSPNVCLESATSKPSEEPSISTWL